MFDQLLDLAEQGDRSHQGGADGSGGPGVRPGDPGSAAETVTPPLSVVLATGNRRQGSGVRSPAGREFLRAGRCLPSVDLPAETGQTFTGNARLKAEAVFAALEGAVGRAGRRFRVGGRRRSEGRPGVLSARFAGEGATDDENVTKLLRELGGVRRAGSPLRVLAVSACFPAKPGPARLRRAASSRWRVYSRARSPAYPAARMGLATTLSSSRTDGTKTLAEATPADKDQVSHRGAAARALCCGRVWTVGERGEPWILTPSPTWWKRPWSRCPRSFKERLENVQVDVEEWPSRRGLLERWVCARRQVLAAGPVPRRAADRADHIEYLAFPDHITIYQKPIEAVGWG